MSDPNVSLHNLPSIMRAAESDSLLNSQNTPNETPSETPSENTSGVDIKNVLNNTNISSVLQQMTSNSDEVGKMMEESMSRMTPDMMEQARKLATGGQGKQIIREMQKRGMDPKAMRAQIQKEKRALRGQGTKPIGETFQVILITLSRQSKSKSIPRDNINLTIGNILKCPSPVELSCSRLALGPLAGKTIKVWYDPERLGKNRRASKILGFPVGGEIVIILEGEDLTEKDFLSAEKHLA